MMLELNLSVALVAKPLAPPLTSLKKFTSPGIDAGDVLSFTSLFIGAIFDDLSFTSLFIGAIVDTLSFTSLFIGLT